MKLQLEINSTLTNERMDVMGGAMADPNVVRLPGGSSVVVSPWGSSDNWLFRVMVSKGQAVIGFRKHGTIAIGFMKETDSNVNLPYSTELDIFEHIKENKADALDVDCIRAIKMIQRAASKWMKFEQRGRDEQVMQRFPELRGKDGGLIGIAEFYKQCKVVKNKYDDLHIFLGANKNGTWKYRFCAKRNMHVRHAMRSIYEFLQSFALYNLTFNAAFSKGLYGLDLSYNGPIPKEPWLDSPHGIKG